MGIAIIVDRVSTGFIDIKRVACALEFVRGETESVSYTKFYKKKKD